MALTDIAATSAFGPNNPGKKGTGTTLGPNNIPTANAALGNPTANAITFDSLTDAAHSSLYGPFNKLGKKGTGITPDLFGNIPSEG